MWVNPGGLGGVFIEQFYNILSVLFCHMCLSSHLLSCHFFSFLLVGDKTWETVLSNWIMLTPTGSTLGWPEVQFQNASYIFYYCATFFFLFSHQIIAKQLLSTWLPIRECHCHQPDLLSDVETQTVNTSFIFTKKSNVAKYFFDICNAEMAQSSL